MLVQEYKQFVGLNIPIRILGKIDELAQRNRLKGRGDAIRQLIDIGLYIESKMGLVETWNSEELENIKSQYKNGQLVDWVAGLNRGEFNTLMHIFEDEKKARGLTKNGRLD